MSGSRLLPFIINIMAAAGPELLLAPGPAPCRLREIEMLRQPKRQRPFPFKARPLFAGLDPRTKGRLGAAARFAARSARNAGRR